jgi:hypothetical protein
MRFELKHLYKKGRSKIVNLYEFLEYNGPTIKEIIGIVVTATVTVATLLRELRR